MKTNAKTPAKRRVTAKTKVKVRNLPPEKTKAIKTRTMPAGQFKTHCLSVIDEVHNRREEVVITKYGTPMARLVPVLDKPKSIFGFMRGQFEILGDLVKPITEPEEWDDEIFPPEDGASGQ
jgi:antitoxin (DNA-binding transcriptional repressor) of toxin-antitoxin stability system